MNEDFEDQGVGGKVTGHGVAQDGGRAERVIEALHAPDRAGGDEGGASQGAHRFVAERHQGRGAERRAAAQSTPEAEQPRHHTDGAVGVIGFWEQGNDDEVELPREGGKPFPIMEKGNEGAAPCKG